jgi:hypothetical protein
MFPSVQRPSTIQQNNLCGTLTTHDPDTYIVVCLHCLHYFRSLTDLLRHRLLHHNILDTLPAGEGLARISKDGSWLVAGGDTEPPISSAPAAVPDYNLPLQGMRTPSGMPTPSPPPAQNNIHVPQFRSLDPHHQMQNPQYHGIHPNHRTAQAPQHFSQGPSRTQNTYYPHQMATSQGSPAPTPAPQHRPAYMGQSATSFSPAAREFVPSGMGFKSPADGPQMPASSPRPPNTQGGYTKPQSRNVDGQAGYRA